MRLLQAILSTQIMYSSRACQKQLCCRMEASNRHHQIKLNSSNPLSKNNTTPGWSFNGTVYYVSAGPNLSLPDNGHAVQLGVNGTISQMFKLTSMVSRYILTFSLAPISKNCTALTALKVSLQSEEIAVFVFEGKYGRRSWETHACDLGSWGGEGDHLVLELQSQVMENDPKVLCGPVMDTVIVKRFDPINGYGSDTMNGGFEYGPIFVSNSSEGTLLGESQDFMTSPLYQWAVAGTVKYVNSKYYLVPEGNAAVELVSILGAIRTILALEEGSSYNLEFVMGVPISSCTGELLLQVQAGSTSRNFSLSSNGTAYCKKLSLTFRTESHLTSIGFINLQGGKTSDHVICGTLIDNVFVSASLQWNIGLQVLFLPSLVLLMMGLHI